jgi:hypothetical protein
MANERIVASGIYYYSCDNITDSRLAFRTPFMFDESYEQDDKVSIKRIWGLDRYGVCVKFYKMSELICIYGIGMDLKIRKSALYRPHRTDVSPFRIFISIAYPPLSSSTKQNLGTARLLPYS